MRTVSFALHRALNLRSLARLAGLSTLVILFQSVCLGQVYTYSSLSQTSDFVVGYSAVTGYYNSSTHVYTTQMTVTAPSGRSTTVSNSGDSATAYLSLDWEHGVYTLSSSFVGTCPNPQGGGNHTVGGSGTGLQVKPFCSIGTPVFLGLSTPTQLRVSVTCSRQGSGSGSNIAVTVYSYPVEPAGSWLLEDIEEKPLSVPDGGSATADFDYKRKTPDPNYNCVPTCTTKGAAVLTDPGQNGTYTVRGSAEIRTANSITVQ